jgi:hypothetical protein
MSQWGCRVCAACGNDLPSDEYTRNQWSYPVGVSRCRDCVQECNPRDNSGFNTARTNNATRLSVDLDEYPFEEGSCRECYLGQYTGGQRTGQRCVVKTFKEDWMAEKHIERDLYAVEKARDIISSWNQAGFSQAFIRLNIPEHWTIQGRECLVEPFIDNWIKVNSNTGWTTDEDTDEIDLLQALSHYSYHVSSGQFVLCDLQGGIFRNGIILTDPVILSRNHRFGVTDLGPAGISSFFYHHECNQYCHDEWTQPRDQRPHYNLSKHTTMSFNH